MKKFGATLTLLLVLGVPFAIANIQTLYSWFPALKPALADAIDVATGYVPPTGPKLRVTHECRYLAPDATQCWSHLRIVSLHDEPLTIEQAVVNDRPECTAIAGLQGLATVMAAQYINVRNKTIKTGDTYGIGVSCEPVSVKIITDKGTWTSTSK
jgi:hypothetical protein